MYGQEDEVHTDYDTCKTEHYGVYGKPSATEVKGMSNYQHVQTWQ